VTTHFHQDKTGTACDIWQAWWCLAHGTRGMIGWVQGWFDEAKKPLPWLNEYKATNHEVSAVQGPKVVGAKWIHDGVAIYYSHPSLQVSWCLDIESHGKTWTNRNRDDSHGTWHYVRQAWEKMLADAGVQYNWVSYDQVVLNGVPKEYKVLILPANYAMSDIEARRIEEFCKAGGTVIADFACGIFDQHGKGRTKGVLDDFFGVKHDGSETKKDFFAGSLWVETNKNAAFGGGITKLLATTSPKLQDGFAIAENKLRVQTVKKVGSGTAVYLNLSPQRYLANREDRKTDDAQRALFLKSVFDAGVKPWVKIASEGKRPMNSEVTYLTKNGRVYVFVVQNASVSSTSLGDTKTEGLGSGKIPLTVEFASAVRDVEDVRAGKKLGDGKSFKTEFNIGEAVVLSYAGTTAVK
jgi:hypothetical protein